DNLLIITWPCGIERPWAPPAGTLDSPGPVDSRSSVGMPILAPLTPYFDRLLIATDMASANDTGNLTLDHGLSTFGMWTGNTPKESSNGRPALQRGPSFEQLIGAKLGEGLSFKTVHVVDWRRIGQRHGSTHRNHGIAPKRTGARPSPISSGLSPIVSPLPSPHPSPRHVMIMRVIGFAGFSVKEGILPVSSRRGENWQRTAVSWQGTALTGAQPTS
ncbi:MAG: hypothetical protein OXR73_30335, partial [Myxococcales bacterium]|nr:hypothetical protein [Myxococcales bacterium]